MNNLHLIWKYPLSWLYTFAVWIRNVMYDAHILRSKKAVLPTICVGNLAVGGTGKTPMTEWLINNLQPYYKLAVVSRGYKRKSKGFVLAADCSTAADIGDECMQLHIKYPDLVIGVCKNRYTAIQQIKKIHPEVQLVLLDDAFQYRRIKADYNILLSTADNLYVSDRMLPLGRLRDNKIERLRADMIVVTKCQENISPIEKRNITISLHLPAYQHLFFSTMKYPPLPDTLSNIDEKSKVILLTGIANPNHLLSFLSSRYKNIIHIKYSDHHNFTKNDIESLLSKSQDAEAVITTEKDFARMSQNELPELLLKKIVVLPVYTEISESEELLRLLIKRFKKITLEKQAEDKI